MQFLDYTETHVRVYHNQIEYQGTPEFECGGLVALTDCQPALDPNGNPTGYLLATCPECGATGCVPLTGGADAQRLHAHVRLADPTHPAGTLADAIESVLADVHALKGVPSVELGLEGIAAEASRDPEARPVLAELGQVMDAARQRAADLQLSAEQLSAHQQRTAADALRGLDAILAGETGTPGEIKETLLELARTMRQALPLLMRQPTP